MSAIDVSSLLEVIDPDDPCGPNLEYDPAFIELEQALRGKPERQEGDQILPAEEPDWGDIRDRAEELLSRTKDLRVVAYLARALVQTEGFPGFAASMELLNALLTQHWEGLHPRLDPEDALDPTMRINAIASLSDVETVIRGVREAPLVSSRTLGRFGLRDLQLATGELDVASGDEVRAESGTIDAAFLDCELEELRAIDEAVEECLEAVAEIESCLMERVGPQYAPDLDPLTSVCKEAHLVMSAKLALRGAGEVQPGEDSTPTTGAVSEPSNGEVHSREDVVRALEKVCEYYGKYEPSSPVPILVRRAQRLVPKDFMEIMRDVAPEGVAQVEAIAGVDREVEEDQE